jgi:hypothetical protein
MSRALWWRSALVGATAAILFAPPASADPRDWFPWCSGEQTPEDNNCRTSPVETFLYDDAPGANPQVPVGVGVGDPSGY